MKRIFAAGLAAVCLLLTGCQSWMTGSYVSVTPHVEQQPQGPTGLRTIRNFDDLLEALSTMVRYGRDKEVFAIEDYDQFLLPGELTEAARIIKIQDPLGAYAVENIETDLGVNAGQSSLAVNIIYRHPKAELLRIKNVDDMAGAIKAVHYAMNQIKSSLVLKIENYQDTDFEQVAADYAMQYPEKVIEVPTVAAMIYPDFGESRVVELKFTYETSRDSLRNMQNMVSGVFASADLYISGDSEDVDRYNHLYGFLAGRYDYAYETAITPSYMLLCHGVGDSKAFATVFAAMCRQADLPCEVVSGSRNGSPWYWNIIRLRDGYYHLDLIQSIQNGGPTLRSDKEMSGYVWDYSAYPVCGEDSPRRELPGNPVRQ